MKQITASRVLFARIGWMKFYGRIDDHGDRLKGGGSWNDHEQGGELCNFKRIRGRLFGYVKPAGPTLNLARIEVGATGDQKQLVGVTVIFVATDQSAKRQAERQRVVGWYRNATVYRELMDDPTGLRSQCPYNLEARAADAVLLPSSMRDQPVPKGKAGTMGQMGQSNVWYPLDEGGRPRNPRWLKGVLAYIQAYEGENLIHHPEAELASAAEVEIEEAAGFESNQRIRKAVEDRAMQMVCRLYKRLGYRVWDRHTTRPYDLECEKNDRKCYVEVKGTRTTGNQILLTSNEVDLPKQPGVNVDLCVVHSISVSDGEKIKAFGGKLRRYENWHPKDHDLRPLSFICELRAE